MIIRISKSKQVFLNHCRVSNARAVQLFQQTRAHVKVGDCKALNFAFIYITLHPKWTSCSRLHIQMCNFKVGLSGTARAIKVN